jgi:hypothetical protein
MITITINSQTMFVKYTGTFYALLVDEYEKEYKVPLWALKSVLPDKSKRTYTKKKSNNKKKSTIKTLQSWKQRKLQSRTFRLF